MAIDSAERRTDFIPQGGLSKKLAVIILACAGTFASTGVLAGEAETYSTEQVQSVKNKFKEISTALQEKINTAKKAVKILEEKYSVALKTKNPETIRSTSIALDGAKASLTSSEKNLTKHLANKNSFMANALKNLMPKVSGVIPYTPKPTITSVVAETAKGMVKAGALGAAAGALKSGGCQTSTLAQDPHVKCLGNDPFGGYTRTDEK